jgi:hypothetical protein
MGTENPSTSENDNSFQEILVETGELNRPQDSQSATERVLDSSAKSGTFDDFPQDQDRPKTAQKDLLNAANPDRGPVREIEQKTPERFMRRSGLFPACAADPRLHGMLGGGRCPGTTANPTASDS